MSLFRLDSVSPKLAESFRKAPSAKRKQAALVACELAVVSAGVTGQEIDLALDELRSGSPQRVLRQRLEGLAAQFDDQYLQLDEEGNDTKKSEAVRLFSKARATSGLAFALTDDSEQLHEAIYEAIAAFDDPGELLRAVERELE